MTSPLLRSRFGLPDEPKGLLRALRDGFGLPEKPKGLLRCLLLTFLASLFALGVAVAADPPAREPAAFSATLRYGAVPTNPYNLEATMGASGAVWFHPAFGLELSLLAHPGEGLSNTKHAVSLALLGAGTGQTLESRDREATVSLSLLIRLARGRLAAPGARAAPVDFLMGVGAALSVSRPELLGGFGAPPAPRRPTVEVADRSIVGLRFQGLLGGRIWLHPRLAVRADLRLMLGADRVGTLAGERFPVNCPWGAAGGCVDELRLDGGVDLGFEVGLGRGAAFALRRTDEDGRFDAAALAPAPVPGTSEARLDVTGVVALSVVPSWLYSLGGGLRLSGLVTPHVGLEVEAVDVLKRAHADHSGLADELAATPPPLSRPQGWGTLSALLVPVAGPIGRGRGGLHLTVGGGIVGTEDLVGGRGPECTWAYGRGLTRGGVPCDVEVQIHPALAAGFGGRLSIGWFLVRGDVGFVLHPEEWLDANVAVQREVRFAGRLGLSIGVSIPLRGARSQVSEGVSVSQANRNGR